MRLLRLRRRDGVACCVTIEVFRLEIEEMVGRDLLQPSQVQARSSGSEARSRKDLGELVRAGLTRGGGLNAV